MSSKRLSFSKANPQYSDIKKGKCYLNVCFDKVMECNFIIFVLLILTIPIVSQITQQSNSDVCTYTEVFLFALGITFAQVDIAFQLPWQKCKKYNSYCQI